LSLRDKAASFPLRGKRRGLEYPPNLPLPLTLRVKAASFPLRGKRRGLAHPPNLPLPLTLRVKAAGFYRAWATLPDLPVTPVGELAGKRRGEGKKPVVTCLFNNEWTRQEGRPGRGRSAGSLCSLY